LYLKPEGMNLISETYLMDCMQGMKEYPDKYFDLAVVDPPYGINFDGETTVKGKAGKANTFSNKQHHNKNNKLNSYILNILIV